MITTKIKMPNLKMAMPDQTFFKAAAIETKKRIRVRTEKDAVDHAGKAFKPYSEEYKHLRAKAGRSTTPNLSFTGKMLGAMNLLVRKDSGRVVLGGQYSKIAQGNEKRGRVFFAFSKSDKDSVFDLLTNWMTRKNKLKR